MRTWLHGLYAVLILVGVVVSCWQIQHAAGDVRRAAADIAAEAEDLKERISKMLTSTWTDTGGVTRTVSSTQKDSESWVEFVNRHDDDVDFAQTKWPVSE